MIIPSVSTIGAFLGIASLVTSAPIQHIARQAPSSVPGFVLKYAPILYLHSKEEHFPTDLSTFLSHTTPKINYAAVPNTPNPLTLSNLSQLGSDVYLTSNDDVTTNPAWLKGTAPDGDGAIRSAKTATIIINEKKDNSIDVFYFYFYAFNPGTSVLGLSALNFGTHVGDWEHVMLRFPSASSLPEAIWYSQHANGQAFRYSVVEKDSDGIRPIVYVAKGSHANYAIPGTHSHVIPNLNLPFGTLEDYTDRGREWDPVLSSYVYKYAAESRGFVAYDKAPVEWLNFAGRWGDEEYVASDTRQRSLFGQKKFVGGPTGPRDKQLDRTAVCPENGIRCILRSLLVPRSLEDGRRTRTEEEEEEDKGTKREIL